MRNINLDILLELNSFAYSISILAVALHPHISFFLSNSNPKDPDNELIDSGSDFIASTPTSFILI